MRKDKKNTSNIIHKEYNNLDSSLFMVDGKVYIKQTVMTVGELNSSIKVITYKTA